MKNKLLAGLATAGLLAGGGSVTALAAVGAPASGASTAAVTSSSSRVPGCGPLAPLVAKGTITKAQAMAIHMAFISYIRGHWRNILGTVLGQQVKNHTITQAQANAVTSAIIQWIQSNRGEMAGHHGVCHHGQGGA